MLRCRQREDLLAVVCLRRDGALGIRDAGLFDAIAARLAGRNYSWAVFVIPAMIAGYAVVHGVTHTAIDSAVALKLLCGTAGLITGIAALMNLNGLGELAPQV